MTTTAPVESAPTIRTAREADLDAIHWIEQASFPQPWPYAAFQRYLGKPGFLVAEASRAESAGATSAVANSAGGEVSGDEGSGVVGYVVADSVPVRGTPLGHVKDVAVAERCRGRGIGSTLLCRAIDLLDDAGAESVKLEVRETNEDAIRLYRRFGFEHRRRVRGYYGNGEDALVMVCSLD